MDLRGLSVQITLRPPTRCSDQASSLLVSISWLWVAFLVASTVPVWDCSQCGHVPSPRHYSKFLKIQDSFTYPSLGPCSASQAQGVV